MFLKIHREKEEATSKTYSVTLGEFLKEEIILKTLLSFVLASVVNIH